MKILRYSFIFLTLSIANVCLAGSADDLIAKAESTRQQAARVGFEWSTTSILITEAKQAIKEGKEALATQLANAAIKQGEDALKQAEYAKANWKDSEPK